MIIYSFLPFRAWGEIKYKDKVSNEYNPKCHAEYTAMQMDVQE